MRAAKRWWRWRRNPLRRKVDVVDAWLGPVTALLLVAGAPAAGFCAASWSYGVQNQIMREQQRSRHPVTAELMQDVPEPRYQRDGAVGGGFPTKVRWKTPGGSVRTGEAEVAAGKRKGENTTVWVLNDGRLTVKPLGHDDMLAAVTATGVWVGVGAGAAVFSAAWWARHTMDRRRLDAWGKEWAQVGPLWRRRTG
ncbi:hypothetical protein ADK70_17855 [Streptomyces rimosus subsp. pseudoverticillatus]|uniref:Rv1733c family protein n=1 Tax=Streptomyces rimosus TaxID=1927 RepID=UPI0006B25CB0|nr:hypothetical protein [Streptomyces rimosus]KOT90139.1 hypothetical protein ADK70_17855 [Streptomyces rimosus subsp. pseudoverticillatus]